MNRSRAPRHAGTGGLLAILAVAVLFSPGSMADTLAVADAAAAGSSQIASVHLKASRVIGFAPMTVVLTGDARDDHGEVIQLGPETATSVMLVSDALNLGNGAVHMPVMSSGKEAADADGGWDGAASLSLVLRHPGKYTVRFAVKDGDRERLSMPIQIRVM